jgi:hypothetical protein
MVGKVMEESMAVVNGVVYNTCPSCDHKWRWPEWEGKQAGGVEVCPGCRVRDRREKEKNDKNRRERGHK